VLRHVFVARRIWVYRKIFYFLETSVASGRGGKVKERNFSGESGPMDRSGSSIQLPQLRVAEHITELVGHTPLLHLGRLQPENGAQIFAKLEFLNPGGSIKDRAALGMIQDAEKRGLLQPEGTIIEATAGNTGVGLAIIGVSRGYKVVLFVPEGFAEEKCILMRGFGATVERTPEAEGMSGAIRRALQLAEEMPGAFTALQFQNPANPEFHEQTTAVELYEQMGQKVDAFVAGVGSGGTFSGVARFLKKKNPATMTVAVETQGSVLQGGEPGKHKVEGIGVSFIPKAFDGEVCDRIVRVMDEDAFATVKRLAVETGVLGGSSAGANVFAAIQLAKELGPDKRIVTIIPDSAERYLSKKIFDGGL
jgi:cysteine synthase A